MAIVVIPGGPPHFAVAGRVGFDRTAGRYVDSSTNLLQNRFTVGNLGPTESRYNVLVPHQNVTTGGIVTPGQGTMRAHHIADHEIQQMVCDFMNGVINLPTLLDRLGALYFTSWIDVVVTPRLMKIWIQWAKSMKDSFKLALSEFTGSPLTVRAAAATRLAQALSSSIANLRVGHQQTDNALNHAIAPRLQRGQFDLFARFIGHVNGYNFALPTLSVETSLAETAWGGHFALHPLVPGAGNIVVNNVFLGPLAGGGSIYISEQDPIGGAITSTIAMPQRYPGTTNRLGAYALRATRSTVHLGVTVSLIALFIYLGYMALSNFPWPKGLGRFDNLDL